MFNNKIDTSKFATTESVATVEEKLKKLEGRIFEEEKSDGAVKSLLDSWFDSSFFFGPRTIQSRIENVEKNFRELDHKFDLLERYLEIEYFKIDEKTATYDWTNSSSNEGFRKASKKYEAMKKEKEKPNCVPCDCDE